ncbi:MAG: hypothetical protein WDN49_24220 [Acetobacteraceae bacterium]
MSLTGPGGIGKTALAIELARGLQSDFDSGVWLVEFASLADPNLVPVAVAEAIGLLSGGPVSPESVARAIGESRLLLVLDNCEHLIDAVTELSEAVIHITPNAVMLVTSRETLRASGEHIYRVPPLDVPQPGFGQVAELLSNSSVQLFVDRAKALNIGELREAQSLRLISEICRQLGGIPLAIEFAAARAASLGLTQIADGLGDRFALLTIGRRTALARHQTLRAVFDWSYNLLPEAERSLLHDLAIFAGGFTLDAACAVMQNSPASRVEDGIFNLVEKSLIIFDRSSSGGRWRLLETVRAYALEKLRASRNLQRASRLHAKYFQDFFATFDPNPGLEGRRL